MNNIVNAGLSGIFCMMEYRQTHPIEVPRFCEANGFYTTAAKSKQMSKIKGKNSKPEQRLRLALWSLGVRYRKNDKSLPGRPDIVVRKHKLAVFVDGTFWHGYDWENRKITIKSNRDFWLPKIERNMQRDKEVNHALAQKGFRVLRFWDHEVNKELGRCVALIIDVLEGEELNVSLLQ